MTNQQKLPMKVKVGLGISSWGTNILILLNTYFLLYFYTNVVGISGGVAGTIMLVARVWDAVNDPMMGVLVDKTKAKEGKCRFWIKYFSVPAAVILTLSFFCPALNTPAKTAWVAVTYILQGMASTAVSVPTNALQARVTDSSSERILIQQISSVGGIITSLTIPSLTLPLARFFGAGGSNMALGFGLTVGIYSIFFAIFRLCGYFCTAGYDDTGEDDPTSPKDIAKGTDRTRDQTSLPAAGHEKAGDPAVETKNGPSVLTLLKETLQNRYALTVSISYIFYLLVSAVMGSTIVYYFQYNLHNTGLMTLYSITAMVGNVLGILTMKLLYNRFGNAGSCALCGVLVILGCIVRWITGDQNMTVFAIVMVVLGYGSGMIGVYAIQCILDSCTWAKLAKGEANQGTIMSVFTFSQKLGQALGSVIAGWLLETVSFNASAAKQSQDVLDLFFAENIIIPMFLALLLVIGFLIVRRFEKKLKVLQREEGAA